MKFETFINQFKDVTELAKANYLYNVQHDFVEEQPGNPVGTEVVYHYLKQFYDHDELTDENDIVEFGAIDADGLFQLVDNLLDDSHIYQISDDLYQKLIEYYDRFGIDFARLQNNVTVDYTNPTNHYVLINNVDINDTAQFQSVINVDLFGGYSNNTKALAVFLQQV